MTIQYAGDAPAFGLSIRTGSAAAIRTGNAVAAEAGAACVMSAAAAGSGCTARIETSMDGVNLALYGCFLDVGDALFDCELQPSLAERLRTDATVRSGCGCQPQCPANPSIVVCDGSSAACQEESDSGFHATDRPRPDVVVTTHGGPGETTCSTCCETDFFDEEIGTVVSDAPLSEFQVTITFDEACQFDLNGVAECDVYDLDDHWARASGSGSTLVHRFCFAAANPADAALSVAALSCKGLIRQVTVTRALDEDFAPLSSTPVVTFR